MSDVDMPREVYLHYKDEKYIYDVKFDEVDGIRYENHLKKFIKHDWNLKAAEGNYGKQLIIDFTGAVITQAIDFEKYVTWHIYHYGNPGGGREADRLQEWLGKLVEVDSDTVRKIARLFEKAKVVIND